MTMAYSIYLISLIIQQNNALASLTAVIHQTEVTDKTYFDAMYRPCPLSLISDQSRVLVFTSINVSVYVLFVVGLR